jgi:SHS2 domain-containing protein
MAGEFHFLEDVTLSDAAFEASGDSPSDLFTAAAHAVIETMADPATVSTQWKKTIEREEENLADLLFEWLSAIVYVKDAEGVVFHGASANVTEDRGQGRCRVQGRLAGEPINPQRHDLRADPKAVTKHLYEVRQGGGRWMARVVLDI